MKKLGFAALAASLMLALPATASAQTTEAASTRAGWANAAGQITNRTINANTYTGRTSGQDYRGYISFPVAASTVAYTSAVVRVDTAGVRNGPNDLTLYDVTSNIATATGSDLYSDFGSGTVLGSITGLNTNDATVDITLNAAGLAAVNAARGGEISFGFVSSPTTADPDGVFGGSFASTTRRLILAPAAVVVTPTPVPTMTEWAMILFIMILAGGAALFLQRRRMIGA